MKVRCEGRCGRMLPGIAMREITDSVLRFSICGDCVRDAKRAVAQAREAAERAAAGGVASALLNRVETIARVMRDAASGSADAGKIAVYEMKRPIAALALAGDEAARNLLTDEAAGRGLTASELAALIVDKSNAWRVNALAIDARAAALKASVMAALQLEEGEALIALRALDINAGWPVL